MDQRDPEEKPERELDDSWFDRPERGLTRDAVRAALETGEDSSSWDGLDDSWFDRPQRR